ncbi:DUF1015 domain-containing protein [Lutimonas sp.]|uniref:DUF1015 domain-containing protein n=1 Tax=Lutimonas sp. TaxID=1872403 RepID=UPI003D9BCDAF
MAKVNPFRAVRSTRDKVALVTTRSYDIYKKKELNDILRLNPFSFLHILRPGFKFHKTVHGTKRFKMVHNRYNEFKENGIFQNDAKPTYYLHQKSFNGDVFWGIIGLASLEDYQNNIIKKHENTLSEREALFGNYLEVTGFNAEPVLITYPDNTFLTSLIEKYRTLRAEYEFTTNKNRTHLMWLIDQEDEVAQISEAFSNMPSLYIADGHHRTASSNFLYEKLKEGTDQKARELSEHFMAYFIPESSMRITSFYRFINDLNGLHKKEFLMALDENFRIQKLGKRYYQPSKMHHFSMYLDGEYYKLYLRKSNFSPETVLDHLDSQILFKLILEPILGIKNPSTDTNIHYLPETGNEMQLQQLVDSGEYKVGFGLFPISVKQLKTVADNGLTMPPKSSYVEPKLRSGLTIYELK